MRLWYDSTWDWTSVSQTISEQSYYFAKGPFFFFFFVFFFGRVLSEVVYSRMSASFTRQMFVQKLTTFLDNTTIFRNSKTTFRLMTFDGWKFSNYNLNKCIYLYFFLSFFLLLSIKLCVLSNDDDDDTDLDKKNQRYQCNIIINLKEVPVV